MLRILSFCFILSCLFVQATRAQWELIGGNPTLSLVHVDRQYLYAVDYSKPLSLPFATNTILRSSNEGKSWEETQITGFTFGGSPWLVGTSYLFTVATLDNERQVLMRLSELGGDWQNTQPDSMKSNWTRILSQSGDTIMIITNHGIFISPDGGTAWMRKFGTGVFHRSYLYNVNRVDTLYYDVKRSTDFGDSWEDVSTIPTDGFTRGYGSVFSVDSLLFVVTYSLEPDSQKRDTLRTLVYLSSDGGFSWIDLSKQFSANRQVSAIARNEGIVYLLFSTFHELANPIPSPHLYTSSNDGMTWKQLPTTIPEAWNIFFNDSNIFLSSRYGTYAMLKQKADVHQGSNITPFDFATLPNPARDLVTISFTPREIGIHRAVVSDLLGKNMLMSKLVVETLDAVSFDLDLKELTAGAYILSLYGESHAASTTIVIQR